MNKSIASILLLLCACALTYGQQQPTNAPNVTVIINNNGSNCPAPPMPPLPDPSARVMAKMFQVQCPECGWGFQAHPTSAFGTGGRSEGENNVQEWLLSFRCPNCGEEFSCQWQRTRPVVHPVEVGGRPVRSATAPPPLPTTASMLPGASNGVLVVPQAPRKLRK